MSQSKNVVDLRGRRPRSPKVIEHAARAESRLTKRTSPLRVRRRKVRAVIALVVIVALLAITYGAGRLTYVQRFSISTISVVGTKDVPSQALSDYVRTQLYDAKRTFLSPYNIFLYHRTVLEKGVVASFPRIESAHLSRPSLFSTVLTVTVEERQPFALWCEQEQEDLTQRACYLMDKGGFVFAEAPNDIASSTPDMYQFEGDLIASTSTQQTPVGRTFESAHLSGILTFLDMLKTAGFNPLGASIVNDQDFDVPLNGAFTIKVSFGEDVDQLMRNLQLIISAEPLQGKLGQMEYIDLRFGDRVYYKLKGSEQTQVP